MLVADRRRMVLPWTRARCAPMQRASLKFFAIDQRDMICARVQGVLPGLGRPRPRPPARYRYELSNTSLVLLQKYAYNYCLCSIVICGDSTDPVALQYGPGSHADMIGAMHLVPPCRVLDGEAAGGAPHASLPLPPRSSLASLAV